MQLREHWPRHVKELEEFGQIAEGLQPEFDEALAQLRAAPEDFFLVSLTEYGVQRWEKIFGIVPDPAAESLELRRQRVYNRYLLQTPFTIRFLRARLDDVLGADQYELEVDRGRYILRIGTGPVERAVMQEVFALLIVRPANLVVLHETSLRQEGCLYLAALATLGHRIRIRPTPDTELRLAGTLHTALTVSLGHRLSLRAAPATELRVTGATNTGLAASIGQHIHIQP